MVFRISLIVLLIGLLGFGVLTRGLAQETPQLGGWSSPTLLGDGWWQSMTVDQEGNVHVSWYGSLRNPSNPNIFEDLLTYTKLPLNGEWGPARNVQHAGQGGFTVRNALTTTSNGILYAVYRAGGPHRFAQVAVSASTDVQAWRDMGPVNSFSYYVDLIADQNDVLHLVYSESTALSTDTTGTSLEVNPCAFCGDPQYIRSTNGGASWSFPVALDITPGGGSDKLRWVQGDSGRLYLTWSEGIDWYAGRGSATDVRFVYTDDGGLTWSDPVILTGDPESRSAPYQLSLTELRDGSLMAVWQYYEQSNDQIYFQISRDGGQTWTSPEVIPGIFSRRFSEISLDGYSLVTDKIGSVHLFIVGFDTHSEVRRNPALFHLVYEQGLWQPARRVFFSPDQRPEWPLARIGNSNNIHLTWFTRDISVSEFDSEQQRFRVYYSENQNIPIVQPTQAFSPTNTPLPTATPVVNLDSTATPFPTVPPDFVNVPVSNADQYASQALLIAVVAIALVCGGILFITRIGR